jgi:hypothetical protein
VQSLIKERSSGAHGRPVCHRFPHRQIHYHRIFRTANWVRAAGSTSHTNPPLCASQAFTHGVTVRYNPGRATKSEGFPHRQHHTSTQHSTAQRFIYSILHIRPWTRRATHHRIPRSVSSVFSGFCSSCLCYAHSARFLRIFCCCCARGHVAALHTVVKLLFFFIGVVFCRALNQKVQRVKDSRVWVTTTLTVCTAYHEQRTTAADLTFSSAC